MKVDYLEMLMEMYLVSLKEMMMARMMEIRLVLMKGLKMAHLWVGEMGW